jgi:D-psicose/D-tagatose/L-ribulose 3-epimerase
MKRPLGFSFLYFAPRIEERHRSWIGRAAHHGYDGVELPVNDASEQDIAFLRSAVEAEGLVATAVGFATADGNPIAAAASDRRAAVDHLGRLAEKAAALGAKMLAGPMHSAYGVWSEAPPTAEERSRCVEVMQEAGERAARAGVTLAIEPLNRFESYFLNTAADCHELIEAIGHPNVVGALDTHHAHIEERDTSEAISASAGTLGHVQLSENHRGTPGSGQVPFDRVLGALDSIGYEGWLVIEAFSRQTPSFGSLLRVWRELDDGPDAVMAAGARVAGSRSGS